MKFYTSNFIEYIYLRGDIKILLVTVNNRPKFEIEIVHDLSCDPILRLCRGSRYSVCCLGRYKDLRPEETKQTVSTGDSTKDIHQNS